MVLAVIMCTSYLIEYTCGCKKEMEFVQCGEQQGSNLKCKPIERLSAKIAKNYCKGHLVLSEARQKFFSDESLD